MNRTALFSIASALLSAGVVSLASYGCADDETAPGPKPDMSTSSSSSSSSSGAPSGDDGGVMPKAPVLGAQIDRMGRPAVNTAVNHTFDPGATTAGDAKDAYNSDKDPAAWVAKYREEIARNLAIYDGLDENCGNQIFASQDAGATTNIDKYGTLASVLADDRLWLDTSAASCGQYLGVELKATGVIATADCGGRTLAYDVIETTYSAVALGAASGFDDGIAADAAKTSGATFPYLAAP